MTVFEIICLVVSSVAVVFITASRILARKAYSSQNKKLTKTTRLLETIGTPFAAFALGMAVRLVFFT